MRRRSTMDKTAKALLLGLSALFVVVLVQLPAAHAFAFQPAGGALPRRRPLQTASRWTRSSAKASPLYARLDDDTTPGADAKPQQKEEVIDYRRPKALKEPPQAITTAMATSSREEEQPSELWVLAETGRRLFCHAFLDPFLRPPPIENYALLIGDLSVMLSFRSLEDTLTTPLPTLDITASPDMIAKGLITYADPLHAAMHIYSVVSDGMTLGLFWLWAVLWGGAEAVDMSTSRSFTLTTLNVFKSWLALCNIRLVALLLQVFMVGEGLDLGHVQMEMSALLITMMVWRWLNVAVMRRFMGPP